MIRCQYDDKTTAIEQQHSHGTNGKGEIGGGGIGGGRIGGGGIRGGIGGGGEIGGGGGIRNPNFHLEEL